MKHLINPKWLLPLLIFLLALIPRLYHLPETFLFGADEEYQATYARTISQDFHLVWIGVSAGNTGFYLGPYWTYLTALILKLSHGDPLATGYFAATLGALTAAMIYVLGKEFVGKKASLLAAFLYAFSPLVVYFDQKYWNPSALPLLSLLLVYSSYKLRKDGKYLIIFAIAIGLIFHVHLSLIPLSLFLLFISLRHIFTINRKLIMCSLIAFILTTLPLIAFDYFHKGTNIMTPLRWHEIKSGLKGGGVVINGQRWLNQLGRIWHLDPGLTSANEARPICSGGSSTVPSYAVIILALLPLVFAGLNILSVSYFMIVIPFLLYPGVNYEYYLLGSFSLYLLIAGKFLAHLPNKIIYILFVIFLTLSIFTLINNPSPYGLAVKKEIISKTMSLIGNAPFSVAEYGDCHRYEGWRYLYTVYGKYPVASSIDGTYGWLYPQEISTVNPSYNIEIYGTGKIPSSDAELIRAGGFTALVSKL